MGKYNVMFVLVELSLWDVYHSVYRAFDAHPDFSPFVVLLPRQDISVSSDIQGWAEFLVDRGVRVVSGYDAASETWVPVIKFNPHVAFYTLGSTAFPKDYSIEVVSRVCRTCYLSYGFLLANFENYQFNQSFHHAAWRVFASTPREFALYEKYREESSLSVGPLKKCLNLLPGFKSSRGVPPKEDGKVVSAGYPKFDVYLDSSLLGPRESIWKAEDSKKIILAPHWTVAGVYPDLNLGNFHNYYESFWAMLERIPKSIEVLFKPHPNLGYALEVAGIMSQDEYVDYLDKLLALPNVSVALGSGYFEYFLTSDALITDSVSFLAEYLPTGKPVLFMNRKERKSLSQVGEELLEAYYHAECIDDIFSFIDKVVFGQNDPMRGQRDAALSRLGFLAEQKTSASRIFEEVFVSLELEGGTLLPSNDPTRARQI